MFVDKIKPPKLCKKCKIKTKKYNQRFSIILLSVALFLLLLGLFIPIILNYADRINNYLDIIINLNFEVISNSWKDDKIVNDISHFCDSFNNESLKVECVIKMVTFNFQYGKHDFGNIINQPEEILNEPSLCRDYAVFYDSIFYQMQFTTILKYTPSHVYNIVCKEDCYMVDQTYFNKI
ncbi:MAG TPA: hypothetical protein VGB37_00675 [Candidatus Lokiarchaeia archaeon]